MRHPWRIEWFCQRSGRPVLNRFNSAGTTSRVRRCRALSTSLGMDDVIFPCVACTSKAGRGWPGQRRSSGIDGPQWLLWIFDSAWFGAASRLEYIHLRIRQFPKGPQSILVVVWIGMHSWRGAKGIGVVLWWWLHKPYIYGNKAMMWDEVILPRMANTALRKRLFTHFEKEFLGSEYQWIIVVFEQWYPAHKNLLSNFWRNLFLSIFIPLCLSDQHSKHCRRRFIELIETSNKAPLKSAREHFTAKIIVKFDILL